MKTIPPLASPQPHIPAALSLGSGSLPSGGNTGRIEVLSFTNDLDSRDRPLAAVREERAGVFLDER
jgi:hypothetical protein